MEGEGERRRGKGQSLAGRPLAHSSDLSTPAIESKGDGEHLVEGGGEKVGKSDWEEGRFFLRWERRAVCQWSGKIG